MRLSLLIIASITAMGCYTSQPAGDTRPSVEYIRDPQVFQPEYLPTLSDSEKGAIQATKRHLEKLYGHPIDGDFSITSTSQGYQVNFHSLENPACDDDDRPYIPGGFGEAWIQDGSLIRADVGP